MTEEPQIISRQNAIELRRQQYFTGKTCVNGHLAPRWISGVCTECARVYSAKWYRSRPLAVRQEINKRAYLKIASDPDKAIRRRESVKRYLLMNRDKVLEGKRRYSASHKEESRIYHKLRRMARPEIYKEIQDKYNRKRDLKIAVMTGLARELGINLQEIINAASS